MPGGTTGQRLTKLSDDDFDTGWVTPSEDAVTSVNGEVGDVVLSAADVGADVSGAAAAAQAAAVQRSNHTGTQAISTVTGLQAALDAKQATSEKGQNNGYASLDSGGKVPQSQLPAIAISDSTIVVNEAAMLALTAEVGDIAIRSDESKTYILTASPASTLANWLWLQAPTGGAVDSVNAQTGSVVLDSDDIDDTGKTHKFTTAAEAAKLAGIEAGADVTDTTNVDAAGAVMNSDASTASMSFVIDEDSFASDTATKVPTQQSTKAYIASAAAPRALTINAQTGTTYTPVLSDEQKLVTLSNASAITCTLPQDSDVAIPIGGQVHFAQIGAGQVTFAAGTGATVNATPGAKCRAQYSAVTAIKRAANTWLLIGDLAA
jgi:hypothetical protein